MSTRSGKRLHNSPGSELNQDVKIERKTRRHKQKENCNDTTVSKKKHYVLRYPSEEEISNDASSQMTLRNRKSRRNTLSEVTVNDVDIAKPIKINRRKKAVENDNLSQKTSKKSKKKKIVKSIALENDSKAAIEAKVMKKKTSSGSVVIEDLNNQNINNNSVNNGNISVDSFHSAAASNVGSPEELVLKNICNLKPSVESIFLIKENMEFSTDCQQKKVQKGINKSKRQDRNTLCKDDDKKLIQSKCVPKENCYNTEEDSHNASAFNILFESNKKSRSSFKNSTFTDLSTDNIVNPLTLMEDQADKKNSSLRDYDNIENSTKGCKYNSLQRNRYSNDNTLLEMIYKLEKKQNENDLQKKSISKYESPAVDSTFEKQTTLDKHTSNIPTVTKSTVNKPTKKKTSNTPNTPIRNRLNSNENSNTVQNGTNNVTFEKDVVAYTFDNINLHESDSIRTSNSADLLQIDTQIKLNTTFEKEGTNLNSTFDKEGTNLNSTFDKEGTNLNSTFDKEGTNLNSTFDKAEEVSSSIITSDSLITNDKSMSRISITSDESERGNINNITPVIVESSLDESKIIYKSPNITNKETVKSPPSDCVPDQITPSTSLQREGTFTKESHTGLTCPKELSTSPGRTPFPSSKRSSYKKAVFNDTRSIEKTRKLSIAELPHATRVMFCSPINTPMITSQIKGKVIKSSMKGSNKSFVLNDQEPCRVSSVRKRSYTHSGSDGLDFKRQRLGEGSSNRVSRSRTSSASGKIQNTPTKLTPAKSKSEIARVARKKLPNFAALHQKQFDKMESLDECQERKARRALLLAAGTSAATKDRDSKAERKQSEMNHTLLSVNPGYTRFGFRMKSDVNPFTTDSKVTEYSKLSLNTTNANSSKIVVKPKGPPNDSKRHAKLPSLNGSTARKEIAKQTVMREKSFAEKRSASRNENRTIIKGVRTNRRFELQMQMRNLN
ncbi:unnamed protein product [Pieris macdunnoughi]|uniref:Uncharacterized protein n=1 Tax=Pieris macdunnoughi TaxID=345717 RepID=A0A821SWV9_9NEOP|nr:unnamed protein product [Pieris macdunnoughi]